MCNHLEDWKCAYMCHLGGVFQESWQGGGRCGANAPDVEQGCLGQLC